MHPPGAETVVVRYGDMSTKSSRVRGDMERRLVENVAALLDDRGVEATVERRPTRPLVHVAEAEVERAAAVASEAFGVVSTSPALTVAPTMDEITDALAAAAREHYDGGTFAVDARRAGDHPFTSEDVERTGGSAVWEAVEGDVDPVVDLEDPDLTFGVEVRREEAFVFLERLSGPGGLPVGTQSRLVALVSGGIDSPVAAYEVLRRGAPVTFVYVDLGAYGGPDHRERALETMRTLSGLAPNVSTPAYVVPGGDHVAALVDAMERGRMLAFRRFCFRVAEHVADEVGAVGVVTGEAVGQKSSQTARNLSVTSRATDLPVHRPLLTADKNDITERAKDVGTWTASTIPAGCNRFAPDRAETKGTVERVRADEPADLFERAAAAAAAADTHALDGDAPDTAAPE